MMAFFPWLSRRAARSRRVRNSFEIRKLDVVDLTTLSVPQVQHKSQMVRFYFDFALVLSAGLDVHYLAIIQADRTELLAFGPILADLHQVSIVWNGDFGFGRTQRSDQFLFACTHLDAGHSSAVGSLRGGSWYATTGAGGLMEAYSAAPRRGANPPCREGAVLPMDGIDPPPPPL